MSEHMERNVFSYLAFRNPWIFHWRIVIGLEWEDGVGYWDDLRWSEGDCMEFLSEFWNFENSNRSTFRVFCLSCNFSSLNSNISPFKRLTSFLRGPSGFKNSDRVDCLIIYSTTPQLSCLKNCWILIQSPSLLSFNFQIFWSMVLQILLYLIPFKSTLYNVKNIISFPTILSQKNVLPIRFNFIPSL